MKKIIAFTIFTIFFTGCINQNPQNDTDKAESVKQEKEMSAEDTETITESDTEEETKETEPPKKTAEELAAEDKEILRIQQKALDEGNIEYCAEIERESARGECEYNVIIASDDAKETDCDLIGNMEYKGRCLESIESKASLDIYNRAIENNDYTICREYTEQLVQEMCILEMVKDERFQGAAISICDEIDDEATKGKCLNSERWNGNSVAR